MPSQKTKTCTKCKTKKGSGNFYVRNIEKKYLTPTCKTCQKHIRDKKIKDANAIKIILNIITELDTPCSAYEIHKKTNFSYYYARQICDQLVNKKKTSNEQKNKTD